MKSDLYLGIDPSYTNTGLIVIDDDGNIIYSNCIDCPLSDKNLAAVRAGTFLLTAINALHAIGNEFSDRKIHVCIEYPMVQHQKAPNAVKVNEAFAVMAGACRIVFGDDIKICYATQWKKHLGVKHIADMKTVAEFVSRIYKLKFDNFDLCSAYGVALYLKRLVRAGGILNA